MRTMSRPEWEAFLREGRRTAKLAYLLPNGRPTVTPVWFVYDDDGVIRIETGGGSGKAKALSAEPRASIVVDLEEPPYAFVRVAATARFVDDPNEVYRVAYETGGRYMGPEKAEEYGRRNGGPGQVVIEFHPTKVTATTDLAD
jgi:PPOX class probable F420-dependent enzyme